MYMYMYVVYPLGEKFQELIMTSMLFVAGDGAGVGKGRTIAGQ